MNYIFLFAFLAIATGTRPREQKTIVADVFSITKTNEGNFSIVIRRNGHDLVKMTGDKVPAVGQLEPGGIDILFIGQGDGNMISLWTKGSASGDYKFADKAIQKTVRELRQNLPEGTAVFWKFNSKEGAKSVLTLTEGILNLTVKSGTCSGSFEGTNTLGGIKYEATGSFNNVPLKNKVKE